MSMSGKFVPTNVPGLDEVLKGGFLRDGFCLLQGHPGSGKTTVALQFIRGRVEAGERCLYISMTETRHDLENVCASHDWSLDGLEICDLTASAANLTAEPELSVFHPSETELGEITAEIIAAVERTSPRYVVFDGLSEMRLLSGSPLVYRRQLLALKSYFVSRDILAVLLDDHSASFGDLQPESLVSCNILLERSLPEYGRARRRLHVTKVRGANFREGYHDYEIAQGGVIVHPRLVAAEHHVMFERKTLTSGLKNLDAMLGGGLTTGSTALLLGPAGVGKSTIAMQFAVNAMRSGSKVAVYLFDEVLNTLAKRVEKLCLSEEGGLNGYVSAGLLHAQQIDPAEMSPGAFSHEVRRAVDDGASIVIIDSLNGYLNAMPQEHFLTAHLHEMFAYLNQKGILTLVVVAQHGMLVGSAGIPSDFDVSYLADTVLLFRYFEAMAEIRQAISVFKKRTGEHERTLRELRITSDGIMVGQSLNEFRGVMTGVPQYDGNTRMLPASKEG